MSKLFVTILTSKLHLDTTEVKNHWAEVVITNVITDRLTAVENYTSNTYRRATENNEGSNSSRDDKPRRKYRIHTDVDSGDEGKLDKAVIDDDKWKIGPTNEYSLSDYLFEYRGCSIDSNNKQKHKQLSMARMMAMHHIFYFLKDSEVSCIRDLEDNYIDTVYEQIPQETEDLLAKIICLLNKSKINEAEKLQTFGSIMVQAASTDNKTSMKVAEVFLIRVGTSLTARTVLERHGVRIVSFTRSLLPASATYSKVQSMAPSAYIDTHGEKFDVVAMEVKPPESSFRYDDMPKIRLEMQKMLSHLVDFRCEGLVVCGVLVDGYNCKTMSMDIKYNGIYRLIEQDKFTLLRSSEDLVKIKHIVSSFTKLKNVADKTKGNVIEKMKSHGNLQFNIDPKLVPKKEWKYKTYEQSKIPKETKKSNE
ncbi:hypothetical protein BDC45DRAFT_542594 [Circinella umbellata]|nr:hypothetical protein BDC45DRAFT_542594 [Circinella umbellata]